MFRDPILRLTTLCAITAFLVLPTNLPAQSGTSPAPQQSAAQTPKKKVTSAKPAAPPPPSLEPRAMDILKAAGARLAGAHTIAFTATETFESLSRQGVPLVYANRSEVTLERPNKLRVIMTGDGPASEFYYDGKVMMAYAPVENLVAVADAPSTIDKTLEQIYHSAGIYFPFTDLIVADPYGDLAPGLQHVYYVGQSNLVGGTTTDIVACAGNGLFMQVWIGADDKLPRGIHAIYLDDPDRLRHNLILTDWQIDSPVAAEAFTTAKASSAKKMPFAHPHPEPAPGARPPVKSASPKQSQSSATPPQSH